MNAPVLPPIAKLFNAPLTGDLLKLRRDLHQYPELAFEEERTAARLEEALKPAKPVEIQRVAGTAVIARIKGKDSKAPVVAVRGDIDALPIEEDTGLDYSSLHKGVMHACGHDVHASWAVGAAHLLAAQPARGDVLVILQPAEEIGAGAEAVLASGVLDGVAAIFGGHVDRRFAVGEVVAVEGPVAASADTYDVTLHGQGAHGARPHEGHDPVIGLGALIGALQTVVSRRKNPAEAAVITIGKVNAGTAYNIIPSTAALGGTLRAITPETRQLLHDELDRIAQGVASAYGLRAEVKHHWNSPPIINPPEQTAWARQAVATVLGEDALTPLPTLNMGGEDFAFYMQKISGCFMRIGAREEGGKVIPAHSPHFYAADGAIFVGAAVLAECARVASEKFASRG